MKWVLYAIALASAFFGIIAMVSGAFVFQQTAGIIMLLIGSTSFGFWAVVGRLDRLAKRS